MFLTKKNGITVNLKVDTTFYGKFADLFTFNLYQSPFNAWLIAQKNDNPMFVKQN